MEQIPKLEGMWKELEMRMFKRVSAQPLAYCHSRKSATTSLDAMFCACTKTHHISTLKIFMVNVTKPTYKSMEKVTKSLCVFMEKVTK